LLQYFAGSNLANRLLPGHDDAARADAAALLPLSAAQCAEGIFLRTGRSAIDEAVVRLGAEMARFRRKNTSCGWPGRRRGKRGTYASLGLMGPHPCRRHEGEEGVVEVFGREFTGRRCIFGSFEWNGINEIETF
jgi:hypothetical protein